MSKQTPEDSVRHSVSQLQQQLTWYKSFFENAADAILVVQPETWSILDANPQAGVLLQVDPVELIGTSLPQFRRIFKLLAKSASPTILSELSLPRGDDSPVMLEVSARFVDYGEQRLIQALARDVSEQRDLTDRLVQADKLVLLGQLSAGIAHEIRNPLAATNLNLQFLQRRFAQDQEVNTYIQTALQGVERISHIVESTLNFSRSTSPITKKENLNSVVRQSVEMCSAAIKRKAIEVTLDLEEQLPLVDIDLQQIQQVLINLLTNASDAIKSRGSIRVKTYVENTVRGDGLLATISIQDSGQGIREDVLSRIFTPFYTQKADGTGLGLPISQRIIHEHAGMIDVESVVNVGTTFYVKLPVHHTR